MTAEQDAAAHALLEIFADTLERQHGPCLSGRAALMAWIDEQFIDLAGLCVPDNAAGEMIATAYRIWQAEALGLDNYDTN
jgi:hypothetical protein